VRNGYDTGVAGFIGQLLEIYFKFDKLGNDENGSFLPFYEFVTLDSAEESFAW